MLTTKQFTFSRVLNEFYCKFPLQTIKKKMLTLYSTYHYASEFVFELFFVCLKRNI